MLLQCALEICNGDYKNFEGSLRLKMYILIYLHGRLCGVSPSNVTRLYADVCVRRRAESEVVLNDILLK